MNYSKLEDWELEREVLKALGWSVKDSNMDSFFLVDPNGNKYVEIHDVPENTLDGAWKRHWVVCQNNYTDNMEEALSLVGDNPFRLVREPHFLVDGKREYYWHAQFNFPLVEVDNDDPCLAICLAWLKWRGRK